MPDLTPETIAELRRRHAALTPFALSFLTGGPGGDPFIALAAEDGSPLTEAGFDAVLLFAEIASDSLPALLDAAAERDALAAKLDAVRALHRPRDTRYTDGTHYLACWECTDEGTPWPCATARALDAGTGGES